jgi:soluble lytic murein transglycosylase-like protein
VLRRRRRALAVALALVVAAGTVLAIRADRPRFGSGELGRSAPDPFAWGPGRGAEFEARAAAGFAHVIYAKSPGGVLATAARVARWRPLVDEAADRSGADPNLLEAIVFLESAGRPDVVAGRRLEGAAGLTQILAETGRNLLGMRVDVAASQRLTRRIARAERRGQAHRARRLRLLRRRVDERFDPRRALAAAGRYIGIGRRRFEREDLAVASYHMGIGNLESVLRDYGGERPSYAQLYFDSTPWRHRAAWALLSSFGDDSSTYWWRVLASRQVMRLYREDRPALERVAALETAKGSAEEVLHPQSSTRVFDDPHELVAAYRDGTLRPFPQRVAGLRRDPRMGELAGELGYPSSLYRGLRPQAVAVAEYMAELARRAGGGNAPLTVTSTVRDREYQRLLARRSREATTAYSLHTTGFAFDVLRRYSGRAQARAFQFALDRLQALNLIAWVREPAAIHVTVAGEGRTRERLRG